MKTWPCEHIKQTPVGYIYYGFKLNCMVADTVLKCPICGAKRPTKSKVKK